MQKIWTIIRHEYWQHLRRKGFLFSTFGMPLVFLGLLALITLLSYTSNRVAAIGYVDQIGLFHSVSPELDFYGTPMRRFDDLDSAGAAVRERRVDVAFVIPPDYLERGRIDALALEVVPALAEPRFERFLQAGLALRLSQDEPSARVVEPIARLDSLVLDAPPGEASASVLSSLIPVLFGVVLLGSTFAAGSYLMLAVAEEKEQRIMEILASSLSPYQMMAGKIIGLGALGLTQLFVWSGGGACLLLWGLARLQMEGGQSTLARMIWLGLLLYLPAYLLIAASLAAIGAAVSSVQEGQQLTGVVTLLCTVPLWFFTVLSDNPNGALAYGLNIFPFSAPVALMQRVAVSEVPGWQIAATVAWLWLCAGGMVWLAGRVVRFGLLRYGRRLSLAELRGLLGRAGGEA